MSTLRALNFAQNAGRAQAQQVAPYSARISPIASPFEFALKHDLEIVQNFSRERSNAVVVAVLFRNKDEKYVAVSGVLTDEWDDHAATIFDDLDFIKHDEALEEFHVALDVLFGDDAATMRRQTLVAV